MTVALLGEYLRAAQTDGVVRRVGVTSHQRALAATMAASGLLDCVMVRYNFLDGVDSLRRNVYQFLGAQDSWIQHQINNILGQDTLHTIAETIVDNQQHENPVPYLEPPRRRHPPTSARR